MQHSSGHITDFISTKCDMAAGGVYVEEGRGNRDAIEEMPRIQLNSRAVHAFCVRSRAVGHDLHTSHVPRPHSADGNGDNAVKIKLREAPLLPRSVAEPMLCDGIYIETSGFNGSGVDIANLLGEGVRMFIPLNVDMSGDPLDGADFLPLATMMDRRSLMSRASLILPPLMASKAELQVVSARETTVRLLNIPRQTVSDTICRFKELGNECRRPGSERKCTVNSSRNRKAIENQRWEIFLFTYEKFFTVQQVHNFQNDRICLVDAPSTSPIVEHRQYTKLVMVKGIIYASGKTPLVFVKKGVKINQKVYRRDIIEAVVLPWDQTRFENQIGCFSKTLQQFAKPKRYKSGAKRIFQT
ncbi:uncharacterized protein TNCV_1425751 [Trichonephila clavipes]|nr:uncharacterized protein TNCV_1425751 [Trichonephila clavipes]